MDVWLFCSDVVALLKVSVVGSARQCYQTHDVQDLRAYHVQIVRIE